MKIVIDTREQCPIEFNHSYITEVKRRKLDFGDYHCEFEDGHSPPIYFERKSWTDLYCTLSADYKRFKREIIRSQEAKAQLILIIEKPLYVIGSGAQYSSRAGESVVQQLFTLLVRHGIWTVYCTSREEISQYITHFYIACGREYIRSKKENEAKRNHK